MKHDARRPNFRYSAGMTSMLSAVDVSHVQAVTDVLDSPRRQQRRASRLHVVDRGAPLDELDERAERCGADAAFRSIFRELGQRGLARRAVQVAGEEPLGAEPEKLCDLDRQSATLEAPLVMVDDDLLPAVERDLTVRTGLRIDDESADFGHGRLLRRHWNGTSRVGCGSPPGT